MNKYGLKKYAVGGLFTVLMLCGVQYARTHRAPQTRGLASAPSLDRVAKPSFTDNVLSTAGYAELIQGANWRKARATELQRAPWSFDARTAQAVIDREVALTRDLVNLHAKNGSDPAALHARESEFKRALLASFNGDVATLDRFTAARTATLKRLLGH